MTKKEELDKKVEELKKLREKLNIIKVSRLKEQVKEKDKAK